MKYKVIFRLCKCKFLMINAHIGVRAPTYQQVMQGPVLIHKTMNIYLSYHEVQNAFSALKDRPHLMLGS
jgi:hypothetical protein